MHRIKKIAWIVLAIAAAAVLIILIVKGNFRTQKQEETAYIENTASSEVSVTPELEEPETEAAETEVPEVEAQETEAPETEAPEMEAPEEASRTFSEDEMAQLTSWMDLLFEAECRDRGIEGTPSEAFEIAPASSYAKAMSLYWYQYFSTEDPRILPAGEYEEVHHASPDDLRAIMEELFKEVSDADMNAFFDGFGERIDENTVEMYATGDFGDTGLFYMDPKTAEISMDGERYCLSGSIQAFSFNQDGEELVEIGRITAWFDEGANPQVANCRFEELSFEPG